MRSLSIFCLLCIPCAVKADLYVLCFSAIDTVEAKKVATVVSKTTNSTLHLKLFSHEESTRKNFIDSLDQLKKTVKKKDFVLIYSASHGGTTKKGFLMSDKDGQKIFSKEICERTELIAGSCTVLIDACDSGGAIKEKWKRTTVVVSSSKEASWTDVMSPAVCEGLCGLADKNNDKLIQADELVSYLLKRIPQIAPSQKPKAFIGENSKVVLTHSFPAVNHVNWMGANWPVIVMARRNGQADVVWANGYREWMSISKVR